MKPSQLRTIPAVEKVLQALQDTGIPRPAVVAIVRRELAALRKGREVPELDAVLDALRKKLTAFRHSRLQPLINGTGILVHTNLGRSPLGLAAARSQALARSPREQDPDHGRGPGEVCSNKPLIA